MCAVSKSPMHLPTPDDPTQPINACSSDGGYLHLGPAVVTSEDVGDVTHRHGQSQVMAQTSCCSSSRARGTQGFADLSTALVNNPAPRNGIAFVVDGLVLSNPYVQAPIIDGYAPITDLTSTEARHLSSTLASGPLPLELTLTQQQVRRRQLTTNTAHLTVAHDLQDGMRWRVRDVLPSQATAQSHGSSLRQEFS